MLEQLHDAYIANVLRVAVAKELLALGLSLYFLWKRNKSPRYQYFWKGFLLIATGFAFPVAGLRLGLIPLPLWQMYAIGLPFAAAGFVCIIRGDVRQRHQWNAGQ